MAATFAGDFLQGVIIGAVVVGLFLGLHYLLSPDQEED